MKFNSFNILLVLVLLIKAFVASKEITKLDSTSNNIMNNGDFFYGKNEKNNAEFVLGLYEIAFTLMYYILGHQDIKYLSPLSQNPDTYILSGNVKYGKLGDDAVFRVYNTDGKEIYKIGEECSVLGQSTMTFESTDAYLNDDEYAVKNVPLTYGVVITNALGEKYYFPPRKTETETETEPVPPIDHMEWIKWDGTIPDEAVSIKNTNGKTFLVGRIKYNYGYRCGYVDLDKKQLDIPSGTISVGYHDGIEILVGPSDHFYWKKVNKNTKLRDGHHIVVGGSDENGNELGIAKCNYDDNYFIGELNLNKLDHAVYFNQDSKYNSLEYNSYNYEVLIYSDESIKQLEWKKWDGTIPSDAVYINNNPNGKSYVVGRINYKNGIHCGYVDVDSKKLTISYGNNELIYDDNFEILTGSSNLFEWKKINLDNKSNYSNQIVIGGNESNGVKLGVAKCKYIDNYYIGKVNLNYLHHSNFGINDVEIECYDFEVLIYKDPQFEDEQVSSIEKMEWKKWDGTIPSDAVYINNNPNGKSFIVGRINYKNGIHSGYVDVDTKKLTISYGNNEFIYDDNFEILTGSSNLFEWKKIDLNNKSDYSNQIVIGGNESNGDKLGVAKCKYNDNYYFGKVNLNYLHHSNFGINDVEIECYDFEVLIYKGTQVEGEQVSFVEKMEWKKWDGTIPSDAVYINNNPNGKSFIVGRTNYKDGIHCGYIDVDSKKLTISYGNDELIYDDNFEILTGSSNLFEWKKINLDNKSNYSNQIVIGGNESNGDKLGVAKCKYKNNYYFGKVNLNYLHHSNFGINNVEIECSDFEVLIYKGTQVEGEQVSSVEKMEWINWNGRIPNGAVFIKDNPNGKTFIVGRTSYKNGIHCGYVDVTTSDMKLIITYGGHLFEYSKNFEVLIGPSDHFSWKKINLNNKSDYSNQIVIGGNESNGDKLGVAKCKNENNYYLGKVNLNELDHANYALDGYEINSRDYEVLIYSE